MDDVTAEPESKPFIIYTVVPCTDCNATAGMPCYDEDAKEVADDVHLARYQLFATARFEAPEMTLADLKSLVVSDYQSDS